MTAKKWILIFAATALLCAAAIGAAALLHKGPVVIVTQNGRQLYAIDLSKVTEPYDLTTDWNGAENVIHVTADTVWVSQADCDNQICVDHGPLQEHGSPITCLPNRLVIRWSERSVDG